MLSEHTIAIVKSTAPVLAEHGETLTRHFYQRMFAHNPEVAPFFNPAHQKAGKQQRALAGAITAYAANVDNLEVLGNAVELIAQKHASLMIKPEHYPIVGENLLASIREVLGAAATDDIINAWAEAYGFLADILIGREKQIYAEQASQKGGWKGFRRFYISRKEPESSIITSFYLVPVDDGSLPDYHPGQYITLRVPMEDGTTTMRSYSLSDKAGQKWLRISVKHERGLDTSPDGYVSSYLHHQCNIGDVVEIAPPSGEFFLNTNEQHERPLVLLGAGVGITPLMSILLAALEATPNRRILLVHACLNKEVQAFRQTLDNLARTHSHLQVYHRYSESEAGDDADNVSYGFMSADYLESLLEGRNADYYFCGPQPFMVAIYHDLLKWGIPASQVRFEFFGPRQELEVAA
jgi:nitric oxide dioxygenase